MTVYGVFRGEKLIKLYSTPMQAEISCIERNKAPKSLKFRPDYHVRVLEVE
jgi:hypothetical protein